MKDLKYFAAYLLPLSAALALVFQGIWAWTTVALAFVVIPLAELFLPQSDANVPPEEEVQRSGLRLFDWLLYLNAPLLFGIVGWYLFVVSHQSLSLTELFGLTLSAGLIVGANGINVAHELGHRSKVAEQALAKWMLLPALYQHFFIEHNRGHHKNVATDQDPASARLGENVYAFWWRSVTGSWRSAWEFERGSLEKEGKPVWSWANEMLRFCLYQTLWLAGVTAVFGWKGLAGAVAVGVAGFLLLETINYIEHYGLRRRLLPSGRPEPVSPEHSWNSDHELGRIFLYELTRHSDHHYKSTRKYQILRHMDESPQLPFGYPASMVLALMPPVWFGVMNPRVERMNKC
ncbi:MAG: alkane 1-monooxygenase [Haliscomenobacteraceae bacterium CHB4]|nr:Alkane 1-monooxygenase 2 [Saprospiraceae bacterium]MCE7922572.1 alkane 1-monooxygenase [Haliscomenobacteraceae bacterium CHB4]